MKNRVTLIALILAIVFAVSSMASFAEEQGFPSNKPGGSSSLSKQEGRPLGTPRGMFRERMDLALSEEQTAKISTMMLEFQKGSLELKSQIQLKQLELRELLMESSVDMEKVRAKLEEMASLQVERKVKVIEHRSKIKEVLTAEQLEELSFGFPRPGFGMERFEFNRELKGKKW